MVMTSQISDKTDMSTMLYSTYCNSRKVEGGMVMTSRISDKTDMSTMLYSTYCNSRKVEGGCKPMVMTSRISDRSAGHESSSCTPECCWM